MSDAGAADRWVILYDAECGFCKWALSVLVAWDRARRLRPVALQAPEAGALLSALTPSERMASWHLIAPDGERRSAGAAFPPLVRLMPGGRPVAAACERFPRVTERGYRWVAEHRSLLSHLLPGGAQERAARRLEARAQAYLRNPS